MTTDYLLFDDAPKNGLAKLSNPELFEKFKAVEQMDEESRKTVESVIDAVIVKNQVVGVLKPHLSQ